VAHLSGKDVEKTNSIFPKALCRVPSHAVKSYDMEPMALLPL
jgi:hypothetical protein